MTKPFCFNVSIRYMHIDECVLIGSTYGARAKSRNIWFINELLCQIFVLLSYRGTLHADGYSVTKHIQTN
jgi:hypothetical protein